MVSMSWVSSLMLAPSLTEQLALITLGVITTARLDVVILFSWLFSEMECKNLVRNWASVWIDNVLLLRNNNYDRNYEILLIYFTIFRDPLLFENFDFYFAVQIFSDTGLPVICK